MFWTEDYDNQLFVFWNGKLIYKKWLLRNYSYVFDLYGLPWNPSRKDEVQ